LDADPPAQGVKIARRMTFRHGEGIIDLNAEVSDGAFDLGVAE
jgi:hypothetical protein